MWVGEGSISTRIGALRVNGLRHGRVPLVYVGLQASRVFFIERVMNSYPWDEPQSVRHVLRD